MRFAAALIKRSPLRIRFWAGPQRRPRAQLVWTSQPESPASWSIPAAVIAAEHDRVTPFDMVEPLADAYSDLAFHPFTVIPGAGHSPDPHQFMAVFEAMLDATLAGPCAP